DLLSELRLALDPAVESRVALAPLIDPNVHSCGSVPPHGAEELKHPETDLYVVGMKSYGRAPTFLMLTGYEQVRSVAAALEGGRRRAALRNAHRPRAGPPGGRRAAGRLGRRARRAAGAARDRRLLVARPRRARGGVLRRRGGYR